ncbi:uncharacterized protein PG998_012295 [Apiospora kogelbergensis]|uniref:uncharacterized protein n=1 Tax=Apiospora kogelbergensis TaxID=1337665 RepID=UPI00312FAD37
MYETCEISCSCGSCASVKDNGSKLSTNDVHSDALHHTIACPQAKLLHGTPQWAYRPCGFCRWQRLHEVRRQLHGVHFLELNTHTDKHDTKSKAGAVDVPAQNGDQETPFKVSDLNGGDMSPGTSDSNGILKGSTQKRRKSVRFEEPPKVEKKRSPFILRFTRERARTK